MTVLRIVRPPRRATGRTHGQTSCRAERRIDAEGCACPSIDLSAAPAGELRPSEPRHGARYGRWGLENLAFAEHLGEPLGVLAHPRSHDHSAGVIALRDCGVEAIGRKEPHAW